VDERQVVTVRGGRAVPQLPMDGREGKPQPERTPDATST